MTVLQSRHRTEIQVSSDPLVFQDLEYLVWQNIQHGVRGLLTRRKQRLYGTRIVLLVWAVRRLRLLTFVSSFRMALAGGRTPDTDSNFHTCRGARRLSVTSSCKLSELKATFNCSTACPVRTVSGVKCNKDTFSSFGVGTWAQTDRRTKRFQVTQCKTRRKNKTRRMNKVEQQIKERRRDGNRKQEMITVTGYDIAFVWRHANAKAWLYSNCISSAARFNIWTAGKWLGNVPNTCI